MFSAARHRILSEYICIKVYTRRICSRVNRSKIKHICAVVPFRRLCEVTFTTVIFCVRSIWRRYKCKSWWAAWFRLFVQLILWDNLQKNISKIVSLKIFVQINFYMLVYILEKKISCATKWHKNSYRFCGIVYMYTHISSKHILAIYYI